MRNPGSSRALRGGVRRASSLALRAERLPAPPPLRRYRLPGWRDLRAHPLSAAVPRPCPAQLQEIERSVAASGFIPEWPICLFEGMVLDGRARLDACRRLGAEPIFVDYAGGRPEEFVFAANIARRRMFPSEIRWASAVAVAASVAEIDDPRDRSRLMDLARRMAARRQAPPLP